MEYFNGGIAKWLNAAVCKTALSEFGGSNPLSSIDCVIAKW